MHRVQNKGSQLHSLRWQDVAIFIHSFIHIRLLLITMTEHIMGWNNVKQQPTNREPIFALFVYMECIHNAISLSRVSGCNVFLGSPPTVRGRGSSVPRIYVIAYMQAHSNNDQILGWSNEMWGTFLLRESSGNADARSVCGSWPCFTNSVRLSGSGMILVFFCSCNAVTKFQSEPHSVGVETYKGCEKTSDQNYELT